MSKRWNLVLLAGLLTVSIAHAAEEAATTEKYKIDGKEVTLARYSKAFIGAGNVRVDVAPYKVDGGDGAILVFHGIESQWDGKAVNHRVKPWSYGGVAYETQHDGKDWNTLIMEKPYGEAKWELYLPDVKDAISLVPSDGAAQLTNPRAVFQEYQAQQKESSK